MKRTGNVAACGINNHMVDPERHHHSQVAKARELSGRMGYVRIGRELGVSRWTARNWCKGITRAQT